MSADVYRTLTLDPSPGATVREAAINPVYSFAVTDATAKARRTVVDVARCNKCHGTVAFHGGQRFKIEECVICHHPNATDDQTPPESIHLKYMVHRIHTGEELERDYTIGDANYNEVLYPGDRRNCEACHTTGTFNLPLPDGVLPTKTARDWYTPMQPVAASCLSCHSSKEAAAHAYMATAPFAEACESCHGPNAEFSVAKVHAR
jgi:OmcA/MtrC family decaheme c-type cytochrome